MNQPLNSFRITLQGPFNVRWADYIGDKLVHVETTEGESPLTELFGHAVDMAAFLGTLNTFLDLGYPVKAFEYRESGFVGEMDGEEM